MCSSDLQRGGTPNTLDRIMGSEMGKLAVELLIEGKSARALGMKCNDVYDIDIDEALKAKNEFNIDMYNTANILSL